MISVERTDAFQPAGTVIPDLSPRSDAALEWWFLHGFIEGKQLGRRDFMTSLFRQAGKHRKPDGHMLLMTSLGPTGGPHNIRSEVTGQLVDNFNRDAPGEAREARIDQTVADAFLAEIAASGPPRPIRLVEDAVTIEASPLSIRWQDFALRHNGDRLKIAFDLPKDNLACRLTAEPQAAWFEGRDLGPGGLEAMAYDCCPRMRLSGTAAGENVSGQVWLDHQWGNFGWMHAPAESGAILGWDWLGISLDDGRDFIVIVHRNMRTRKPVSQFAVAFHGHRDPEFIRDVTITGLGDWRSPETMIDFPTRCRIDIPSRAVALEFTPLTDHQEVPVFGLIDAIWEGLGRITGTIEKQPVSGRARLELHGYGYVHSFSEYQKKWIDRIDRNISAFLPQRLDQSNLTDYLGPARWSYDATAQTEMLSRPVWDLLSRGGKHWRPIFGYLLLDALGVDVGPFETMLSTISELVHNGSVIIDDIEDSSLTRRGHETIHLRYGLPTAINAGNTLYFLPLLSIAGHAHLTAEQRDAIYEAIVAMLVQAHFGQAQDLYWSKLDPIRAMEIWDEEKTGQLILQAHAFKSAAAVRATAEVACIIAQCDSQTRSSCTRLAESWGVAFQIVDDVNNFNDSRRWGKVCGEDVSEGKVSYAIHKAVRHLEGAEKDRLLAILTSEDRRRSKAGLAEGIRLIESSGALEACRSEARELVAADWPGFSRAVPSSRAKFMLRALLETLLGTPFET